MSKRRTAAALLTAVLLFSVTHAQETGDADLKRVRAEIERLRQRLDDLRAQARTTEQELEAIDLDLGIRTRELEVAQKMEATLAVEQQTLERDVEEKTRQIAEQKEFLARRLVALYRLGSLSYVRMLLSMDDGSNPIEAMSMLTFVVGRDARAVSQFQAAKAELRERQMLLSQRQQELAQSRADVERRRRAVQIALAQKQRKLQQIRAAEQGSEAELARLEEKAVRLQRLVGILMGQQAGITMPGLDIRSVQGALEWPVHGKVIERFGRHRNPKFATYTTSNGLKIEAAPGEPVRAVFQGTVLFSQWFKGYGNLIIVDHGNRVFSLYGNLKAPSIQAGDRITTGQPLAGVGEGEDSQSYLYFEIRNDNRPEDPQLWLR